MRHPEAGLPPDGAAAVQARGSAGGGAAIDRLELLFWDLMGRFERLALARYGAHAPELATHLKQQLVERLDALPSDEASFATSELAAPVEALLARAQSTNEVAVLIVQGLILEHLGLAIYRIAASNHRSSGATRALAAAACDACASVTSVASTRIAARIGTSDQLFVVFADVSHEVMSAIDALAEPVDHVFGEQFGLRFADVLGEFSAELITACTALGMQRRKVVAHLAAACMGL